MSSKVNPKNQLSDGAIKGEFTRTRIIETALRIASRTGIESLTIGDLARTVGMSKSGLFAHFRGRDRLQLDVLTAATTRFVEAVLKPAFTRPRGKARLLALVDLWLEYIDGSDDMPGGSVLIAACTELDDRPGPLRDFVQKSQKELISNLEKAATLCIETGDMGPELDPQDFAWRVYSFVLGYHHSSRLLNDPKARARFHSSLADLLNSSDSAQRGRPQAAQKVARASRAKSARAGRLGAPQKISKKTTG
jgi:AcrR family transcriptional regulator